MRAKNLIGGMLIGAGTVYALNRERRGAQGRRSDYVVGRKEDAPPELRYGARLGDIAGLEAATPHRANRNRMRQLPLALRVAGGALVLYGLLRRGRLPTVIRTIGMGLLARRFRGVPRAAGAAERDRRRVVDIQKTLHIEAPVGQVYSFWSNYENFPLFMSNIREVQDLGSGRSRWSVRGPGGAPIRWDARLTEQVPNEVIAWRSEPAAMLENAGVIRFQPEGTGTRLDLRFCYLPPAGGAGQAVTELLGTDPRAKLNEDLGRLKALLEATVRSETRDQESGS